MIERNIAKTDEPPVEKVFHFIKENHLSESSFSEWFNNSPSEQIIDYLIKLNNIIRQKNTDRIDGVTVFIGDNRGGIDYVPPQYETKLPLLNQAIDSIKTLPSQQDQGLLAHYAIQNIHPFENGNRRTGRLVFNLFCNPQLSIDELKLLLKPKNQYQTIEGKKFFQQILYRGTVNSYINRDITKTLPDQEFFGKYSSIHVTGNIDDVMTSLTKNDSLNKEQKDRLELILQEGNINDLFPFKGIVWLEFFNNHPELKKYMHIGCINLPAYQTLSAEDNNKPGLIIDAMMLLRYSQNIDTQHLIEIINIHNQIKEQSITTLIDIFINPNKHTITTQENITIPIKDLFIRKETT
jgi:hypothetical protein